MDAFPSDELNNELNQQADQQIERSQNRDANFFSRLPRPIIGYIGGLHRLLDVDLLTTMMLKRPEWSWVFVGGITSDLGKLETMPNAHFLGQRPHGDLARCIAQFDVCIVPYLNNALTATVVPMKIGEYLAMGKPVVSTSLPTVCEFNDRHQVLITTPNEPESFLRAIEDSLSLPTDRPTVSRRREVAAIGDGNALVERVSTLIETKINEKIWSARG